MVEVIAEAARTVNRYPDNGAQALAEAISARFGVPAGHVAVGCGSVKARQSPAARSTARSPAQSLKSAG